VPDKLADSHVETALRQLRVGRSSERLEAARLLSLHATQAELEDLERARARELDHYVSQAIGAAIARAKLRPRRQPELATESDYTLEEQLWDDALQARALRATTTSLVHELRRPLGLAILAASHRDLEGVNNYLKRMDLLLDAMERMVQVASGGTSTEFDLAALAQEIAQEHSVRLQFPVQVSLTGDMVVTGDREAVALIIRNGIANACESALKAEDGTPPVVVDLGRTDRDAWIAILDRGDGIAPGLDPFAFAATRKEGHLGVGLTLARQAARSIGGELSLTGRRDGGAILRLAWPQNR
jgi:signal transduction histidine kinase